MVTVFSLAVCHLATAAWQSVLGTFHQPHRARAGPSQRIQKSCREGATSIVWSSLCHVIEPPEIPSEPLVREGNKSSHILIDTSGPDVTFSGRDPS